MGPKKLQTTQRYMHLLNLDGDEWTCSEATTKEEAMKLIEAGFEYVTTIEGVQLFKKRKYIIFSVILKKEADRTIFLRIHVGFIKPKIQRPHQY